MIKGFDSPIYITSPLLPSLDEVQVSLEKIWQSKWLTNHGVFHNEFEERTSKVLNVKNVSIFNNGTIALLVAIRALNIREGEVITTPFTFAATPHCISWNGLQPVFCDVEEDTMTIDSSKIENHITDKTRAILGVHVYGFPCDVEKIQKIANKHNLKVIYDAAHAFSAKINGVPIGRFGDISMFSFHATKLFNSVEGGCLTYNDDKLKEKIYLLRNFGIMNEEFVCDIGMNGKMSEIHAAIGLLNYDKFEGEKEKRKQIYNAYVDRLSKISGIKIPLPGVNLENSYQYFVIRVLEEEFGKNRNFLYDELKKYNVFSRKYFYPLCSDYAPYEKLASSSSDNLAVANVLKEEVLCLPFYGDLSIHDVQKICDIIAEIKGS
jgi:dTDP-4-amino-4,6-dideoxygalactose transaminase